MTGWATMARDCTVFGRTLFGMSGPHLELRVQRKEMKKKTAFSSDGHHIVGQFYVGCGGNSQ